MEIEIKQQIQQTQNKQVSHKKNDQNWVLTQTKVFTNWCNVYLKQRDLQIQKLETELSDGVYLGNLLEILSGKNSIVSKIKIKSKSSRSRLIYINNLNLSLKFIQDEGIKLVGVGSEDIVDCNLKLILGLIWTLILRYQIQAIGSKSQHGNSVSKPTEMMISWVKFQLLSEKKYFHLTINDLTTSFQDGLLFCALVHKLVPEKFKFKSLNSSNKIYNLTLAFDTANKELNIPSILDPQDIVSTPDELSILTYLSFFMKVYQEKLEEKASQQKINKSSVIISNQQQQEEEQEYYQQDQHQQITESSLIVDNEHHQINQQQEQINESSLIISNQHQQQEHINESSVIISNQHQKQEQINDSSIIISNQQQQHHQQEQQLNDSSIIISNQYQKQEQINDSSLIINNQKQQEQYQQTNESSLIIDIQQQEQTNKPTLIIYNEQKINEESIINNEQQQINESSLIIDNEQQQHQQHQHQQQINEQSVIISNLQQGHHLQEQKEQIDDSSITINNQNQQKQYQQINESSVIISNQQQQELYQQINGSSLTITNNEQETNKPPTIYNEQKQVEIEQETSSSPIITDNEQEISSSPIITDNEQEEEEEELINLSQLVIDNEQQQINDNEQELQIIKFPLIINNDKQFSTFENNKINRIKKNKSKSVPSSPSSKIVVTNTIEKTIYIDKIIEVEKIIDNIIEVEKIVYVDESAQDRILKLENEIKEKDKQLQNIKRELKMVNESNIKTLSKISSILTQFQTIKGGCSNGDYNSVVEFIQKSSLIENYLEVKKQEIHIVIQKISTLQIEYSQIDIQIQELIKQVRIEKEKNRAVNELQSKLNQTIDNKIQIETQLKQYQLEKDHLEKDINIKQLELDQINSNISSIEINKSEYQTKYELIESELYKFKELNQTNQQNIIELLEEIDQIKNERECLTICNQEYQDNLLKLSIEVKERDLLIERINNQLKSCLELNSTIQQLENDKEQNNQLVLQLSNEKNSLEIQVKDLQKQLINNNQLNTKESQQQQDKELLELQNSYNKLNELYQLKQAESFENQTMNMENEFNKLKDLIQVKDKELLELQNSYDKLNELYRLKQTESVENQIMIMENEVNKLKDLIQAKDKELLELKNSYDKLNELYQLKQTELVENQIIDKENVNKLKDQLKHKDDTEEKENKTEINNLDIISIKNQLNELKQQQNNINNKQDQHEQLISSKDQLLIEKEKELVIIKNIFKEVINGNDKNIKLNNVIEEHHSLRLQIEEKDQLIKSIQTKYSEEINNYQLNLNSNIQSLQSDLNQFKNQINIGLLELKTISDNESNPNITTKNIDNSTTPTITTTNKITNIIKKQCSKTDIVANQQQTHSATSIPQYSNQDEIDKAIQGQIRQHHNLIKKYNTKVYKLDNGDYIINSIVYKINLENDGTLNAESSDDGKIYPIYKCFTNSQLKYKIISIREWYSYSLIFVSIIILFLAIISSFSRKCIN